MKGQDIVVLAKLCDPDARTLGYAGLSSELFISASEIHAAVGRLRECGLLGAGLVPHKRNLMEFLLGGLRYAFPFRPSGAVVRGIPTAWAAPIAQGAFAVDGFPPVWEFPDGSVVGPSYAPLYSSVPKAVLRSRSLYDLLALFDLVRGGRIRERTWAKERLEQLT